MTWSLTPSLRYCFVFWFLIGATLGLGFSSAAWLDMFGWRLQPRPLGSTDPYLLHFAEKQRVWSASALYPLPWAHGQIQ